ncbi:MAG: anthrone oxygenase family protein [Candidatus Acidiferrales bacterium]
MTTRNVITLVLLWISVLSWSVYVGGTIYQMVVIDPIWNASLPESLGAFFKGTNFLQNIVNFFGPRTMPVRYLPLLGLLFFGWDLPKHRPLFVIAAVCMTIGLVFTLAYIYPINAILFTQAGGDHTVEEVRAMAHNWIVADRVRLSVISVGYLALLRALSIEIAKR